MSGSEQDREDFSIDCFGRDIHRRLEVDLSILDSIEELGQINYRIGLYDHFDNQIAEFAAGIALVESIQQSQRSSSCSFTVPMMLPSQQFVGQHPVPGTVPTPRAASKPREPESPNKGLCGQRGAGIGDTGMPVASELLSHARPNGVDGSVSGAGVGSGGPAAALPGSYFYLNIRYE